MRTLKQMIEEEQGWDTPIVQALEDLDFYKFTMAYVYYRKFPDVTMEMKAHCRTKDVNLAKYAPVLERELDHLCTLQLQPKTLERLSEVPYFSPGYMDLLKLLRLNRDHTHVTTDGDTIGVRTKGPALLVTWFETHVLQILQEAYFRDHYADLDLTEGVRRLNDKIESYQALSRKYPFAFSEFGARRRAFFQWQRFIVKRLVGAFGTDSKVFKGTSDVFLSAALGLPFSGTMAHEYLQIGQGLEDVRLSNSVRHMLEAWVQVYRGNLGIALSDIVGMNAFLRDFDLYYAKLYDGMRHDSGDPFEWADKALDHYEKLRIDPRTKTLLFSDGVKPPLLEKLVKRYYDRARIAFGIGGDFTNDLGVKGLNIVMKAVRVNGNPVAKESDSPGKGMCEDPEFRAYIRKVFGLDSVGDIFEKFPTDLTHTPTSPWFQEGR